MTRAMTPLRSLLALLIVFALGVGIAQPAAAATTGVAASLQLNGETYDGTQVVNEGDTLSLKIQYDDTVTPGSTVVFELGPNVTLSGAPTANSAIAAVVADGNKVSVTFRDPWPTGISQGVFDLKFRVDDVEKSAHDRLTWKVDGQEDGIDVIVRDAGDQFENVTEAFAKGAQPSNLDRYVTVVDGIVKLDPAIAGQDLKYTLRMDSPSARTDFPISDQLPAGLSLVDDSFASDLTTWDAQGLNRTTSPFAFAPTVSGGAFQSTVDVPGPSSLAIAYTARVTDIAALEAQLQARYDALNGGTGSFQIQLTNTAKFDETTRTASIRVRGSVPGVDVGRAFGKTADITSAEVRPAADGSLDPAVDVAYTLHADLRQWKGGPNFTLTRNVVISDTLVDQATWKTSSPTFVTASGIALTAAASCPADAAAFADDAYIGQYCVDGRLLLVNVGRDNTTNATIVARAQVNSIDGLPQGGTTTVVDATPYRLRNVATFDYGAGSPYQATRDVTVVALPDAPDGLDDPSVFSKTGTPDKTVIDPGQSVTVGYTLTVAAGKGIDARTSTLVDHLDPANFDVTEAATAQITGTYDGQALTAADFTLETDGDDLVIRLSPSGIAVVDARGADRRYTVHLVLTTKPFEGKQTKTISNRATLLGPEGDPLYVSSTASEATSYGDEAEVRKRVFDRSTEEWSELVGAPMDGAGHLVDDTYVYRIQFLPHGSYDRVVIVPVLDVLPAGVEFLGFVDEANAASGAGATPGPIDVGGNLVAAYDSESRTVSIRQKTGTVLDAAQESTAYFAVRVTDPSAPIVNRIGVTSATIMPLPSVSVGDLVWVDSDGDGRQDEGEPGIRGVVLTIVGPDGMPVTDVDGNVVGPVATDADGRYLFENLPALSGMQTYTVRIDRTASAAALAPYTPTQAGVGDREGDSSLWEASSLPGGLHGDGDSDLTLDFGFVLVKNGSDPGDGPDDVPGALALTGGTNGWGILVGGAALLAAGLSLFAASRVRRRPVG